MKKRLALLLCLVCLPAVGCSSAEPEEQTDTNPSAAQVEKIAETLDLSTMDFSGVKAIDIHSGITGNHLTVNDAETLGEILSVIRPLKGESPISSRGYYGWSYGFSLYTTENPGKEEEPFFTFSIMTNNTPSGAEGHMYHGIYEIVNGHSYSGLYSADGEKIADIDAFCEKLMEDNHDKLYAHEFTGG